MIGIAKIIRILDLDDLEFKKALDFQFSLQKKGIMAINEEKSEIEAFLFSLWKELYLPNSTTQKWITLVSSRLEQEKLAQIKFEKIQAEKKVM